ncbi:MAG: Txe/YoeB family addiction module toxin [Pyramidobacter sp.]|nr:Txe/YoeB family addiction module toxin [Pyramidobacter sp.]
MSKVVFTEKGWEHYQYWLAQNRKIMQKIARLIKSIERDGALNGEGQPEQLRYAENAYSRHIDDKNRLVYRVEQDQIVIEACLGHYEDK